ncbi:MAG: hypothetical protein WAV18_30035 [Roseiarcus sp.]
MNETLAKCEFSATLANDARIRPIFGAAKMEPEFALHKSDADELIAERRVSAQPTLGLGPSQAAGRGHVPDRRPR